MIAQPEPIAPQEPAAAPAPLLPSGWSTDAVGNPSNSIYNLGEPREIHGVRAGPGHTFFGTANSRGLVDNGFYNVTEYVNQQNGGHGGLAPVYYNPTTGLWANFGGRGGFQITDKPQFVTNSDNSNLIDPESLAAFMMAIAPVMPVILPAASAALGGGMLGTVSTGAIMGGGSAALTGGHGSDVAKGAALGGITGAIPGAVEWAKPQMAELLASLGITDAAGAATAIDEVRRHGGMLPAAIPETDPTFGGALAETAPGVFQSGAMTAPTMMPAAVRETDPTFGGALAQTGAGQFENAKGMLSTPDSGAKTPQQQQQHTTASQEFQRLGKLLDTIANMSATGSSIPADAPQQQEGESTEQYLQQIIQYANVDAQTMSDIGLKPGSPEYYKYVMDQMDSIIAQLTDGMDLNAPNLADQLHTKTNQEMQALQRALFVRGQIDKLAGSGSYTDPFTGRSEDVIAQDGFTFQPDVAAYQRGLAHSADTLAGLQGTGGAQDFLDNLLHRNSDLYGMQKGADTRYEQALKSEEDLRRRGMLGQLSEAELQQLLQSTGL